MADNYETFGTVAAVDPVYSDELIKKRRADDVAAASAKLLGSNTPAAPAASRGFFGSIGDGIINSVGGSIGRGLDKWGDAAKSAVVQPAMSAMSAADKGYQLLGTPSVSDITSTDSGIQNNPMASKAYDAALSPPPKLEYVNYALKPDANNVDDYDYGDDVSAPDANGGSGAVPPSPYANPFGQSGAQTLKLFSPTPSAATVDRPQVDTSAVGSMGPAFGKGGVASGYNPQIDEAEAQLAAEDAAKAKLARTPAPVSATPTAAPAVMDSLKTPPAQAQPVAPPRKLDRDTLLKMSGENVRANDDRDRNARVAESDRLKKKDQWDTLRKQELSSADGVNPQQQVQALSAMARLGDSAAAERLRKLDNNPYAVRSYNQQVGEQQATAQAQQKAQERQQQIDKEAFDKEKAEKELALKVKADAREDQRDALAKAKDERDFGYKSGQDAKGEVAALAKDQRDFEQARQLQQEKIGAVEKRIGLEESKQLQERAYNYAAEAAMGAVQDSIAEMEKYQGLGGRLRKLVDGKDVETEINKVTSSYQNKYNDARERMARVANLDPNTVAPFMPDLNLGRIKEAIQRRGPETSDDILKSFQDIIAGGKFAMQYGTAPGRAATAIGETVRGFGMFPQGGTQMLPAGGGFAPFNRPAVNPAAIGRQFE